MFRCTKFIFILFVPIYYHQHVTASEKSKLLFVQIIFRHGDRAPFKLYPTDPNHESVWPEGLGKLSKLGRKQHYALGKFFRKMYEDFITTNPLEVNVSSSAVDRCIRSALSNVASFYAPDSRWKFEDDLPWQPIPVYYIPEAQDKYLYDKSDCPRAFEEQRRIVLSPSGQAFIKQHLEMFKNLTHHSGLNITDWTTAYYLYNTLFIESANNLVTPEWVLPWWDELHHVTDMSFYWRFSTPLIQRLRAGPLLGLIIQKMNMKISGDLPDQLVQIYSTHDNNIAPVMMALKLFNMKAPTYCASLIFELHELSGSHFVRLLFLNSTNPAEKIDPPHVLVLYGCQEFCPLDYFTGFTRDLIPQNWEKECGLQ